VLSLARVTPFSYAITNHNADAGRTVSFHIELRPVQPDDLTRPQLDVAFASLTPQMFIDQLSPQEKRVVMRRLSALYAARKPADLDIPGFALTLYPERDGEILYSLRAGNDLRILFTYRNNTVVILDVVRNSQIERLAHDQREH